MINFEKLSYRETLLNGHTIVFRLEGEFDSPSIALLVECMRVSEEMNTSLKVIGINNKAKSVLEMMNLPTLFDDIELTQIPWTNNHVLYRPKAV